MGSEAQALARGLVKVWAGLGREEGRSEAEWVLYQTSLRLADRLERPDLAATAHAAGVALGLEGAARRWEAWARRVLGDTAGIPIEAEQPPGGPYRELEAFRDRMADGSEGPELMVLPGGVFRMGDLQGGGDDDEQPVHQVTVERFAIGVYAVTFDEYDRFWEVTARDQPDDEGWGRARRPVINVSWFDAEAYCEWLSERSGQRYRLPTEAQWEYACRAQSEGKWCFGNEEVELEAYAWHGDNAGGKTHPVGEKKANAWGLYDLHGNVDEWTGTVWEGRYEGQETEVIGKKHANYEDASRVVRGGSWDYDAWRSRSSSRGIRGPAASTNSLGFRPARIL